MYYRINHKYNYLIRSGENKMKPHIYYTTLCSLMFLISSAAQAAGEMTELEINHPIASAQQLEIQSNVTTISAVLGSTSGTLIDDLDYFVFAAQEGDVITLDIDGGIGGTRSVDTALAVFNSTGKVLRSNDNALVADEGSIDKRDALIENFRPESSGNYVVAVSNYPRVYQKNGILANPLRVANGDYKLIISGVTPSVQQINIDIKPGNDELAPLNPKSKGKIPVALLSSKEFNALNADTTSLSFGSTGKEISLSHCNSGGDDFNNDGLLDLLCHFENQQAGFVQGDLEAILRGKQKTGSRFEGRALMKVVVPELRSGS
jgi:hypothetical protein